MSMVVLSATSGERENIFGLLVKVFTLIKLKTLGLERNLTFLDAQHLRTVFFFPPVTAFLKWHG